MNYIISAGTDIGIRKNTNQDSLTVKIINAYGQKIVFALLCDGMGGLAKGEVASAQLVNAFNLWIRDELPAIAGNNIEDSVIRTQWQRIVVYQNRKIMDYGKRLGIHMGTTVVVMLITNDRYYIMNVGDSRAYQITDTIQQLTKDQTVVAKEIERGNLTIEQGEKDPRRSVLLQCIGASETVCPDFFFGDTKKDAVYMLCSDGFRHEVSQGEMFTYLEPGKMSNENSMKTNIDYLIHLNKSRMEQDNISVITVRTY